jgi:hypothetical protein
MPYDGCPECRKVMKYTPRSNAQWYCGKCQAARGEAMQIAIANVRLHDAANPAELTLEGTAFATIAEAFMEQHEKGKLLDVPWLLRIRVTSNSFGVSAVIERATPC